MSFFQWNEEKMNYDVKKWRESLSGDKVMEQLYDIIIFYLSYEILIKFDEEKKI